MHEKSIVVFVIYYCFYRPTDNWSRCRNYSAWRCCRMYPGQDNYDCNNYHLGRAVMHRRSFADNSATKIHKSSPTTRYLFLH